MKNKMIISACFTAIILMAMYYNHFIFAGWSVFALFLMLGS